jgi:hypothetical protein
MKTRGSSFQDAAAGTMNRGSALRRSKESQPQRSPSRAAVASKPGAAVGRMSKGGAKHVAAPSSTEAGLGTGLDPSSLFVKRTRHFICSHNKRRTLCATCGGKSLCVHGRQKMHCKACRPKKCGSFCRHGRQRSRCVKCEGVGRSFAFVLVVSHLSLRYLQTWQGEVQVHGMQIREELNKFVNHNHEKQQAAQLRAFFMSH